MPHWKRSTEIREITMLKSNVLGVIIVLSIASLGIADTASAATKAKKLTYEQAWAECKKDVVSVLGGEAGTSAARYTRGAACMKQHGYRLKKSSM
jgi:hypothetical protein